MRGHAIEARLCAEDAYDGFRPQTGQVLRAPQARDGVRIDTGVEDGCEVSPYYNSMVAKVIAHGRDREEASRRLALALEDEPLLGLPTNQGFLARLLRSDAFRESRARHEHARCLDDGESRPLRPAASFGRNLDARGCAFRRARGRGRMVLVGKRFRFFLDPACADERKTCATAVRATAPPRYLEGRDAGIRIGQREASRDRLRGFGRIGGAPSQFGTGLAFISSVGGSTFVFKEAASDHTEDDASDGSGCGPGRRSCDQDFRRSGAAGRGGANLALIEAMKMETRVVATSRRPRLRPCMRKPACRSRAQRFSSKSKSWTRPPMSKAILTCALNGVLTDPRQHPMVPVTPERMAQSAREAYERGRRRSCMCIFACRRRAWGICRAGSRRPRRKRWTRSAPPVRASSSIRPPA